MRLVLEGRVMGLWWIPVGLAAWFAVAVAAALALGPVLREARRRADVVPAGPGARVPAAEKVPDVAAEEAEGP